MLHYGLHLASYTTFRNQHTTYHFYFNSTVNYPILRKPSNKFWSKMGFTTKFQVTSGRQSNLKKCKKEEKIGKYGVSLGKLFKWNVIVLINTDWPL